MTSVISGQKAPAGTINLTLVLFKDPTNIFDYCGCMYPEGVISSERNLLFNHDQISRILYMGYNSEKEKEFKEKLAIAVNKVDEG